MSSSNNSCCFIIWPAPTISEPELPNVLRQPNVEYAKPWIHEKIHELRSRPTLTPTGDWVGPSLIVKGNLEVQSVGGVVVVIAEERPALMIMATGCDVLKKTMEVNGMDAALAALHLGRQKEAILVLMNKLNLPVRKSADEVAFMESLFSDKNIAWMASVLRHIGVGC